MKTTTVTEQQIEDMWWKLQSVLHEMVQLDNAIADLQSALKTLHDLGKEVK